MDVVDVGGCLMSGCRGQDGVGSLQKKLTGVGFLVEV